MPSPAPGIVVRPNEGRLAVMLSPELRRRIRRPTHGTRYFPAHTRSSRRASRHVRTGRSPSSPGTRSCSTPRESRTSHAMSWWPRGEKCNRSGAHMAGSPSCCSPQRFTITASCRAATTRRFSLKIATRPRMLRSTGVLPMSGPSNIVTVAPVAASFSITASSRTAMSSGSAPGRSMSLPPALMVTRSGRSSMAGSSCSSTMPWKSRPRIARLAYAKSSVWRASSSATRSAQPRTPPGTASSGSPTPSVKESPIETMRCQGCFGSEGARE